MQIYFNSYFKEAVLDIFNCQNVTLDSITCKNNTGNGRLEEPVRGNTGGIGIGYNMLPADYSDPSLTLSNSVFSGNQAIGFLNPEIAVTGLLFQGRGGGVGIYMNESVHHLWIVISDCLFEGNLARLFGGGLFMLTTSYTTVQHQVWIQRCQFIGNMATSGGGGMQLAFLGDGDEERPNRYIFTDCLFERNQGASGGGIYIFVCKLFHWCTDIMDVYFQKIIIGNY